MKEITITVNYGRRKTKEYEICIVPNKFNVDFVEYAAKEEKLKHLFDEYKNAGPETREELTKQIESMEGILKEKYDLIATIMIANEYIEKREEFDYDFWDTKVSPGDIDSFLAQCMMKDKDTAQLKKKLKRISP